MSDKLLSISQLVECIYGRKNEDIRKKIDYYRREGYIPEKFIEKDGSEHKYKEESIPYITNLFEIDYKIINSPLKSYQALNGDVNIKELKNKISTAKREYEEMSTRYAYFFQELDSIQDKIINEDIDFEKEFLFNQEKDVHTFNIIEAIKEKQLDYKDTAERAYYYTKIEIYDVAESLIDEVIEENPDYWKAHFIKAIIYVNRLNKDKGKLFENRILLESDPDNKCREIIHEDLLNNYDNNRDRAYESLIKAYQYWGESKYNYLVDMMNKRNLETSIISLAFDRINYLIGGGIKEEEILKDIILDHLNTTKASGRLIEFLHIAEKIGEDLYQKVFSKLISEIKKEPSILERYIKPDRNKDNLYVWAFNYHLNQLLSYEEKIKLIEECRGKAIRLKELAYWDILIENKKFLKFIAEVYESGEYEKAINLLERELDIADGESQYYSKVLYTYLRICYDLSEKERKLGNYIRASYYYIKPFTYEADIIKYFQALGLKDYLEEDYDGFQYDYRDFLGDYSFGIVDTKYFAGEVDNYPGYIELLKSIYDSCKDNKVRDKLEDLYQKYIGKEEKEHGEKDT